MKVLEIFHRAIIMRIISFCLAFVLLVVSGYFIFFRKDILGKWELKDELAQTFLEFKPGGVVTFTVDCMSIDGTYQLKDQDTVAIDVSVNESVFISGEYNYAINQGISSRELVLTDGEGHSKQCRQYSELYRFKVNTFVPRYEVVGIWKGEELEYEFTDLGNAKLRKSNMTLHARYDFSDDFILMMWSEDAVDKEAQLEYTMQGNTIIINGMEFTRQ